MVHKSRCMCVCWGGGGGGGCSGEKRTLCVHVLLLTLAKVCNCFYVHCFIGFTFAFKIDHVLQEGERTERGGGVQ